MISVVVFYFLPFQYHLFDCLTMKPIAICLTCFICESYLPCICLSVMFFLLSLSFSGLIGDRADHASITQTLMAGHRATIAQHALNSPPASGSGLGPIYRPCQDIDSFVLSQKEPTNTTTATTTATASTHAHGEDPVPNALIRTLSSASASYRRVR